MSSDANRREQDHQEADEDEATQEYLNESEVIAVNEGEWKDWTSTWRKAGTGSNTRHVTMTGTIVRGKKRGQSVDVELDLTDHELTQMTLSRDHLHASGGSENEPPVERRTCCGLDSGPHVTLWSIMCFPFVLIGSLFVSFYFGVLTWQNIFTHFYDERTICHRIMICPLLVIFFPFIIVILTIGISIFAAIIQISWSFEDWKAEVVSFEKGFYGWLCSKLSLEFCCPYTVVTLTEGDSPVFRDASPDSPATQHQSPVHNNRSLPANGTHDQRQESSM